jgi:hypothetical protein
MGGFTGGLGGAPPPGANPTPGRTQWFLQALSQIVAKLGVSRGEREIAARMGAPRGLHGLLLVDAIDEAHIGSTFDESRHADRDLGLAIFATHQRSLHPLNTLDQLS